MRKKIRWRVLNDEIYIFLPKDHQDNEAAASLCQGVLEALLFKNWKKHSWKTTIKEIIITIFGQIVTRIGSLGNLENV